METADKICGKTNAVKSMIAFITIISLVFISVPSALAQQQAPIKTFKPPARVEAEDIVHEIHGQDRYDIVGEVFSVPQSGDRIVVGDKSFNFSSGAGPGGVRQGMNVGLKLNEKREVVRIDRLDRQGRRY